MVSRVPGFCRAPRLSGITVIAASLALLASCGRTGEEAARMAENPSPVFLSLWDFRNPDSTEARFLDMLSGLPGDADPGLEIQLLTQIARAQGLQGRFNDGHQTLERAESMLRDDLPVSRTRWHLEKGRLFNSGGRREESRPLFKEAWDLARGNALDGLAVDAAHMLGIVEEPEAALEWNHRALELVEASEDPKVRAWLGPLYNNIGWTHHDRGEYEEALDLFRRDAVHRTELGQEREARIARWSAARTLRSLARLDEALSGQLELLAEWTDAGQEDGYVYEELAECLLALGRPDEARPHFAKAHALLSADPWLQKNEPERLQRLEEMGRAGPDHP